MMKARKLLRTQNSPLLFQKVESAKQELKLTLNQKNQTGEKPEQQDHYKLKQGLQWLAVSEVD